MQTQLQGITKRSKESKKYRFRNLYTMLNKENLLDCWKFLRKDSAPGIDKETAMEYQKNLEKNVEDLVERLKQKKYKAKFVKRVYIPKGNGKQRPLGLPAIEDKLVQIVVKRILEAIYEPNFLKCSFGYRPNTSAKEATKDLQTKLQFGKYKYIVEADIKGFFDNMEHEWIVKMLEQRVDDKAFIGLIKKWLKAGILETDGKIIHLEHGTPQGGIVSPILANMYLHYVLDLWFEGIFKKTCRGQAYLCRYADDFVCAFEYQSDAQRFYQTLPERMQKFNLELSMEKTKMMRFSRFQDKGKDDNKANFIFLGFEFRWETNRKGKRTIRRKTSKKKLMQSKKNIREWCKNNRNKKFRSIMKTINAKLRGHYNYYGVKGNYKSLKSYYYEVVYSLFKWMNRRSQKKSFNWEIFNNILEYYKIERPRIAESQVS